MFLSKVSRVLRKQIVKDFGKRQNKGGDKALIFYKTEPLVFPRLVKNYSHTNNWELLEMVRILNNLGFIVDVIDRDVEEETINNLQDEYHLFIGLGTGNSGRNFPKIAKNIPSAIKVFYATSPESTVTKQLVFDRYELFKEKHPDVDVELRRYASRETVKVSIPMADAIFSLGNKFAHETYAPHGKKIYRMFPSSSPRITCDLNSLKSKDRKKFLYFGGNGNIVKGLDIVVEAFAGIDDAELYICAPREEEFDELYWETIEKSDNIHFLGFIEVGGEEFQKVTAECAYVILPSCAEGTATSVTTCMRRGLIPVVTKETGIDLHSFGFLLESIDIPYVQDRIIALSNISEEEVFDRSMKTYIESLKYTQKNFSLHFESAVLDVLKNHSNIQT